MVSYLGTAAGASTTADHNAAATYTTLGSTAAATLALNNIILSDLGIARSLADRTFTLPFTNTAAKGIVEATGATTLAGTNIKSSYWLYIADGTLLIVVRADFQLSGTDLQVRYADARYRTYASIPSTDRDATHFEGTGWTSTGYQVESVNITSTAILATANASIDTATGNAYFKGSISDSSNNAGTAGQILSSTTTGTDWVDPQYLGYQTVHHTATSTLAVTHADHNLTDLHIENTGGLSMDGGSVDEGTTFFITNTTATDSDLSFTNVAGAYLRNGGTQTDLKASGLTLKANTRYLVHITDNSGKYVNVTEAGGGLSEGTTANNTLRWDGSAWVASNALTNDGTDITVTGHVSATTLSTSGNTTVGGDLQVNGAIIGGNSTSALVNAGVAVSLGDLSVRIPTGSVSKSIQLRFANAVQISGTGRSLAIPHPTGAPTATYSDHQSEAIAANTWTYWNSSQTFGTHGSSQEILFYNELAPNERYRVSIIIGQSYNNNMIAIERL